MSGALTALSSIGGIAQQALPTLAAASGSTLLSWIRAPRSFAGAKGMIIPDVTIEKSLTDRLTVTQHPVAKGSPISDHAYKLPPTVTMRIGFSNSSIVQAGIQGFMSGGGFSDIGGGLLGAGEGLLGAATEQRCKQIYDKLLVMQFDSKAWDKGEIAVTPIKLTTGKRAYEDMVITEISVRTDHTSEYSLMVEVQLQQVIIVKPGTTTQPAQADQKDPSKTGAPTETPNQHGEPTETPPKPSQSIPRVLLGPPPAPPGEGGGILPPTGPPN